MKAREKRRKKIILPIIIIAALLVAAAVWGTVFHWYPLNYRATPEASPGASQTPANAPNQTKASTPDDSYQPPADNSGITITARTSGDSVVITTELKGYSDGQCSVNITKGTQHLSQTAEVVYARDYSTCAGFSVPIESLGAGTWGISLSVSSGGSVTSKDIKYEVSQ